MSRASVGGMAACVCTVCGGCVNELRPVFSQQYGIMYGGGCGGEGGRCERVEGEKETEEEEGTES